MIAISCLIGMAGARRTVTPLLEQGHFLLFFSHKTIFYPPLFMCLLSQEREECGRVFWTDDNNLKNCQRTNPSVVVRRMRTKTRSFGGKARKLFRFTKTRMLLTGSGGGGGGGEAPATGRGGRGDGSREQTTEQEHGLTNNTGKVETLLLDLSKKQNRLKEDHPYSCQQPELSPLSVSSSCSLEYKDDGCQPEKSQSESYPLLHDADHDDDDNDANDEEEDADNNSFVNAAHHVPIQGTKRLMYCHTFSGDNNNNNTPSTVDSACSHYDDDDDNDGNNDDDKNNNHDGKGSTSSDPLPPSMESEPPQKQVTRNTRNLHVFVINKENEKEEKEEAQPSRPKRKFGTLQNQRPQHPQIATLWHLPSNNPSPHSPAAVLLSSTNNNNNNTNQRIPRDRRSKCFETPQQVIVEIDKTTKKEIHPNQTRRGGSASNNVVIVATASTTTPQVDSSNVTKTNQEETRRHEEPLSQLLEFPMVGDDNNSSSNNNNNKNDGTNKNNKNGAQDIVHHPKDLNKYVCLDQIQQPTSLTSLRKARVFFERLDHQTLVVEKTDLVLSGNPSGEGGQQQQQREESMGTIALSLSSTSPLVRSAARRKSSLQITRRTQRLLSLRDPGVARIYQTHLEVSQEVGVQPLSLQAFWKEKKRQHTNQRTLYDGFLDEH